MPKKSKTLKIIGRTIDRTTQSGVAGLRVEAWDKDLICDDLVGSAVTDAQGSFQIEFDESYFRELFSDRRPDLFFKVFHDGRLVHSTEDSVLWNVQGDKTDIVIEGDFESDQPQSNGRQVKGRVLFADGSAAAGLAVKAFDRDLRSEQELGEGRSDNQGLYQIDYRDARPGHSIAPVGLIVKAFADDGAVLATSPAMFDPKSVAEIDLTIPVEILSPPPLFEKIGRAIAPLLKDVKVEDLNEDEQHRDISFLSGRTGFEKAVLARYVLAHKLAQPSLVPEFWFALLHGSVFQFVENKNLDDQLKAVSDSLSSLDAESVGKSLLRALNQNEISKTFSDQTEKLIESFLQFVASHAVADTAKPSFLKSAAEAAGIKDPQQREKFARLFNEQKAFTPELLTALENDKSFKQEEVADLHTSFRLAELTQGDFSVVKAIKEEFDVRRPEEIRTLAKKSQSEWVEFVSAKLAAGEIKLPIEMRAAADAVKLPEAEVFGKTLERQFREAFPTTAFAGGLARALGNGGTQGLRHAEALGRFLERHEDFELLRTPVDDFLQNNTHPDFEQLAKDEGFRQEVKAVQRVFKLAPTFAATDALLADGLHSAQQIYRLGESQFVQRYGEGVNLEVTNASAELPGQRASSAGPSATTASVTGLTAQSASAAWNRAADTHATVLTIVADLKALDPNSLPSALRTGSQALSSFPNWENLFQTGDLCDCEACRSVISPAAYFADLLMYLKDRRAANPAFTVKDVLFRRRPDLGYLELNCENALTTLPYIDVVCEVLEAAIATGEGDVELIGLTNIPDTSAATKTVVASALQGASLGFGADFSLSQVDPLDPDRWVVHGENRTYLLKKKTTANFFAEVLRNTKTSAAEMRAYPQYVNPKAYEKLREAKYPMALPFDLFAEEVRATMQKINLQRWDLMSTFRGAVAPNSSSDGEIAAEYFGLSAAPAAAFDEKRLILIADATLAGQQTVWGETNNLNWLDVTGNLADSLCIVKTFLQKTGLEYNELLTLLDLKFINQADDIAVHHLDPSCDTSKKIIEVLDETKLDRIHRFLRLWRKLKGWKMWELDLVIRHPKIGNGALDEGFLIKLFYFARLKDRLGKRATVEQVCALFGHLNTETRFTKLHEPREDALYQQLFLNRRLISPLDPAFELDPITGDLPAGQTIPAHRPVVVAALGLREPDLVILEELEKASDGSAYITHDLTLANLSFLWRHSWLSKLLKFKADDWKLVLKLVQQDIASFPDPRSAWDFVALVDQIKSASFTPDELNWLLAADRSAKAAVKESAAARLLSTLRSGLQKIHAENDPAQYAFLTTAPPTDEGQLGALLTTLLQKLNWDDATASLFLAVVRGSVQLEAKVQNLPAAFTFPAAITAAPNHIPIQYDEPNHMFRLAGVMTDAQRTTLRDDPSPALTALQGSGQLEASTQGLPSGYAFPAFIIVANNIPIQYDEPNLKVRFTGLMTDAQRAILRSDASLALVTGIPDYLTAIEDLYQQSLIVVTSYQAGIDDLYQQSLAARTIYASTEGETALPGGLTLPPGQPSLPISYNPTTQAPGFIGVMTAAERTALIAAGNPIAIIDELFQRPRLAIKFFEPAFSVPLAELPPAIDFKAQLPAELSAKISYDAEQRLLRFAGIMSTNDSTALESLVLNVLPSEIAYHNAVHSLFSQPHAIVPAAERVWLTDSDLDPTQPSNDTLAKRLANAAVMALNYLSKTLAVNAVIQQSRAQLKLTEAMTRLLLTRYAIVPNTPHPNKTLLEYLTEDFADTTVAVDYSQLPDAFNRWFWATRVAAIWKKWKVTLAEWEQLTVITVAAQLLDLLTLPLDTGSTASLPIASIDRFLRIGQLLRVRDSLPETGMTLLEVLEKLSATIPATIANISDLANSDFPADVMQLNDAWSEAEVKALVESFDLTNPSDYLQVETWERLGRAFYYLDNLNAGTDTVETFAAPFMSDVEAMTLKELLRTKFGAETWLSLSTEIQDVLRERKRDALAAYLLTQPPAAAPTGKWENTNDLYAYYLLDVEMSSCQLTSRLVQASGSVQLFVQRCFMGLEPDVEVKADGATGDSAWRWWKWMRKFQVWVANRKVFLWPENWIEPELKKDRSQFFKDLENELLQNEINQPNVETAFANYLEKLDGVAQLEIAGFYQEDDGDNAIVHVFGRTRGAEPHLYYYRRYDYHQWTPWEKVELDIQGNYLIPAVVERRLFLFWPVFTEVSDELENSRDVPLPQSGATDGKVKSTQKMLKLQMAVSENRQGKWTPKRISNDFVLSDSYGGEISRKHYRFFPIDRSEIDGRFGIRFEGSSLDISGLPSANLSGAFEIAGCKGVPELASLPGRFKPAIRPEFFSTGDATLFQKWLELGPSPARFDAPENDFTLETYGPSHSTSARVLVQTPWLFSMTPPWHLSYFDKLLLDGLVGQGPANSVEFYTPLGSWLPFFYNDKKRTFFVLPSPSKFTQSEHKDVRDYYPQVKKAVRQSEDYFEGEVQKWLADFKLGAVPAAQRAQLELFLQTQLSEERSPPYRDDQLKELLRRYFMWFFHWYLGTQAIYLFQSRQFHFKNFYHPFVCDFARLVYNPLEGIPALMRRETQLQDSGFSFRQSYAPTFWVVSPPSENFYPKEIVDFTPDGAYSSYNWELFFHAPLLIANALSKNQRFEEARDWYHFIFNPIGVESSVPGGSAMSKYWITQPFFKTTDPQYVQQRIDNILEMLAGNANQDLENQVLDSRNYPFEPHRIANYRTAAYQKTTVMKYLDNLIAWGDNLFRQDSMESINEATQLYVLAAELLGPPPKNIPPQARPPLETFNELENEFDKFSNALVQVENLVPPLSGSGNVGNSPPLPMLYFCIPHNEKMLGYWNTVADRLYKIRHCMNIEGVVRQLALFEPPIDPGALVKAVAGGVDISSALADLTAPLPLYRFNLLLQKANEVCNDVKGLGGALLAALEKKDAEELGLLRQGQEIRLLEAVKAVREQQIEEAKENLEGVKRSKATVEVRRNYYRDIEKIIAGEQLSLAKLGSAQAHQNKAQNINIAASILGFLPNLTFGASGVGGSPHVTVQWGTGNIISALQAASGSETLLANIDSYQANRAATYAGYDRRFTDWKLQQALAERELSQMDTQIAAAELRVAIADKELENHLIQIENAKATDAFMRSKYTNEELYQWQVGQISGVYFQSYKLAYDLAKRAERCFRFELGLADSSYISFGYWDSLKKGLLSGEKLQYDLRRLETAYLDQNHREFELTKHVSLALLDPLSLIKLKETGRCFFQLPEELFDLDYPGHYFRRIKSVSVTLPCVTGPYTTISCTLRLLSSNIRITTDLQNGYAHSEDDNGLPADDTRFIENNIPVKAIAASSAQNDGGVFELNFRDDRYLPFEGAGAISGWALELFTDLPANNPDPTKPPDFGRPLRQFDYETISDAIVHVKYTAREDAGPFKNSAVSNLRLYFRESVITPSLRMLNLREEFPSQWHRFLTPTNVGGVNIFEFEMSPSLFQIKDMAKTLKINTIWLVARCTDAGVYKIVLTLPGGSSTLSLPKVNQYGGLHFGQKDVSGLEVVPTDSPVLWQLQMTRPLGANLQDKEVEDLIMVLGYQLDLQ
jgi:Tc toxin complex TcA C-terminal TcB-binding domain/Neuraminidase-like domain/Salmonella virulence plasmid 28.1kDa A protein